MKLLNTGDKMKHLLLLTTLLTLSTQAKVSVECYYHFTDSILEITPEMRINKCTADFVWGFDNVCFRGEESELVDLINEGYFRWGSTLRVLDAKLVDSDTIEYTGVDAQSFYSSTFDLARCK